MFKLVIVSFAFLALAFYELSGGDEFTVIQAERAAEKDAAVQTAKAELLAADANKSPDVPGKIEEEAAVLVTAATAQPDEPDVDVPAQATFVAADGARSTNGELAGTSSDRDVRQVSGSRVNVRSGPGTRYGVLVSLPRGTPVEVIDSSGSWVKLRVVEADVVGWMSARLLSPPTG